MSIPLATLRSNVRRSLAIDEYEPGFDDDGVDLLLNRTYWEIQDKFHLRETESSTTITTVAGERDLSLPASFDSLRISAILDPESEQQTKLNLMSIKEYASWYNEASDNQAFPTHYLRESNYIRLWPTPDDEYDIIVSYRSQLADLSNSNTDPNLPRSWQELLEFGASWRGAILLGDTDKQASFYRTYTNALATAVPVESKELDDTSMSGLQPIRGTYP